jgi:hypothetical protein
LRSLLQSLLIPFEEGEQFTYPKRFAYTEQLDRLQSVIPDISLVCIMNRELGGIHLGKGATQIV